MKQRVLEELQQRPFEPAWWLRGGAVQTVASTWIPHGARPAFELERWTTPDDDFLRVHLRSGGAGTPLVLVLHGLEGSVDSRYIASIVRQVEPLGWGIAVLEHRSCGGEMNRALKSYHSGETGDVAFVVQQLSERFPGRRLYVFGVSLGGNMLLKWFGEQGDELPAAVVAGATLSPPFDLAVSGRRIDTWLGGVAARTFLDKLMPKAIEKAARFPGALDVEAIRRVRTLRAFDDAVTAPLNGFRDAEHYWTSQSCKLFLDGVRRPALVIASRDDPLNPEATIPSAAMDRSPFLIPLLTDSGGHAAFLSGRTPWTAERWAEERVARFFALCEDSTI